MSFVPNDYTYNVSRGNVSGAYPIAGFGERVTTGAASGVLWADGTYIFPPSSGTQVSVVSTSASDSAAGTGARTLSIHYLDVNLAPQEVTATLNGVTPVLLAPTNIRFIQNVHVVTFGSDAAAAGNISVYNGTGTYAQLTSGRLRDTSSVFMVPAGKRLLVTSFYGGSNSGAAAARTTLYIATTNFYGHDYTASNVFIQLAAGSFQDNSSGLTVPAPIVFTEGQSVGMTFTTDKMATITGSWFGWVENA